MQEENKEQQESQKQYAGNIQSDLGFLTLYDYNNVLSEKQCKELKFEQQEKIINERALQNLKALFHQLMNIKTISDKEQNQKDEDLQIFNFDKDPYDITLPEKSTILPRQKPIPEKRPLTRWERFAHRKGIRKRQKRSRMVWDEITQDWVPRWGYKSKKQIEEQHNIIYEHKENDDIYEDPFERQKLEKKLEREKQKLQTIQNKTNEKKTLKKQTSLLKSKRISKTKDNVKKNLAVAQKSTASMGVYDKKAHKEEQQLKIKKRKIIPDFKSTNQERNRDMDIINSLQQKKAIKQ